jgi:hypothetical protein
MVCAKCAQTVELAIGIHVSHVCPLVCGHLHGKRTGTAASASDQHGELRLTPTGITHPLQGDHAHVETDRCVLGDHAG